MTSDTVDFGYSQIKRSEKTARVGDVFSSVARRYDLMNDLMSFGLHRLWKRSAVELLAPQPGQRILDLAGGSGDLTALIAPIVGPEGSVNLADINADMLQQARVRLLDAGIFNNVRLSQADAEQLPWPDNHFSSAIIGFGLRNVTERELALSELLRVLQAGAKLVVLEFSQMDSGSPLSSVYETYSSSVIPRLGQLIVGDKASYQYLVESIRMFPTKQQLVNMLTDAGFIRCQYRSMANAAVALHWGYKP